MTKIHPTAIVDAAADLDADVEICAWTRIGPDVRIGAGSRVAEHCVVEGRTTLGRDCRIGAYNAIGCSPQDKKYAGEPTELVLGDRNTVFQFCTFSVGTAQDGGVTRIGSDNWIMAYVHVAHDCRIGDHATLANNVTLAGHVHLGDWVTLGGFTGVHQFVQVGSHVMAGFMSHVSQDVPPYMTVDGNPLAVRAYNAEGLKRRGFDAGRIAVVRQMHRLLYRSGLTLAAARDAIAALVDAHPASADDLRQMVAFLDGATRGIVR